MVLHEMKHLYFAGLPSFPNRRQIVSFQRSVVQRDTLKEYGFTPLRPQMVLGRLETAVTIETHLANRLLRSAGRLSLRSMLEGLQSDINNLPSKPFVSTIERITPGYEGRGVVAQLSPATGAQELQAAIQESYRSALTELGVRQDNLDTVIDETLDLTTATHLRLLRSQVSVPPEVATTLGRRLEGKNVEFRLLVARHGQSVLAAGSQA